jgi:hypothetical protein
LLDIIRNYNLQPLAPPGGPSHQCPDRARRDYDLSITSIMTYTTVYNPFKGEAFSTKFSYLKDVHGYAEGNPDRIRTQKGYLRPKHGFRRESASFKTSK